MLLEPVYEREFLDCSFGFRPGRSAHQALEAVRKAVMATDGGWVLDVDVRKYFDTIPHQKLREVLSLRIRDGVISRLVGKWLKAGIWEAGQVTYPEAGTPQGGVITPPTHLATSSLRSDCRWCAGRSFGIDRRSHMVLLLRPIESSLLCATFPAREPSFPMLAGKGNPLRGGSILGPPAWNLRSPRTPIRSARAGDSGASGDSAGEDRVYGEAPARLDPEGSADGTAARRADQRLGGPGAASSAGGRFAPWLNASTRRDWSSGSKPWEIAWQWRKWRTRMESWCRARGPVLDGN